jgi:hypothetical protein
VTWCPQGKSVAEVFSFPVKNGRVLFGADTFQFYQAERSARDGNGVYKNTHPPIYGGMEMPKTSVSSLNMLHNATQCSMMLHTATQCPFTGKYPPYMDFAICQEAGLRADFRRRAGL